MPLHWKSKDSRTGKFLFLAALALACAAAADHPKWPVATESIAISDVITDSNGKERRTDLECNTTGRECKLKAQSVTLYYSGPRLVMMETRHNNQWVIKKRLQPSDDGKTLNLEVIDIVPQGRKSENYSFMRQVSSN